MPTSTLSSLRTWTLFTESEEKVEKGGAELLECGEAERLESDVGPGRWRGPVDVGSCRSLVVDCSSCYPWLNVHSAPSGPFSHTLVFNDILYRGVSLPLLTHLRSWGRLGTAWGHRSSSEEWLKHRTNSAANSKASTINTSKIERERLTSLLLTFHKKFQF